MDEYKNGKIERVLAIYTRLINGIVINKAIEAQEYGVNERSIQRDIDDIRNYMESESERTVFINSVIYDRMKKGYRLEQIYKMKLTNSEVLAVCKILLDSRAFTKKEMTDMLDKLITCCVSKENQKMITDLIEREAEKKIDRICIYLEQLESAASEFYKILKWAQIKYYNVFEPVQYTVNMLGKTDRE